LLKTYDFTHEPDPEEGPLVRVLQAWGRILARCLDTLASVNHKDVLKWWASPKNEVASQHPFELPQNSSTLVKYSRQWQCFVCYVMRTAPEGSWEDESETGVKYSEEQWQCVDEVRLLLLFPPPEEEAASEGEGEGEREEGGEGVAAAGAVDPRKQDAQLTTAVMALIMSLVTQDTSRMTLYESPVMHYLAVRGVNPQTQTFHEPFTYTPILAQMLWIIRVIMLEIALPLEGWDALGLRDRTRVASVPRRVHSIREKHLCEGSFSPASSILTQLARGKAINKLHRSASNIYWSDDRQTVYYHGKGVAMAKITTMCHELACELQEILHELLFHQGVPDVPLADVVDSMGAGQYFRRDNFSFTDHADNAKICKVDWQFLFKRMLQDAPEWQMVKMGRSGSGSGSSGSGSGSSSSGSGGSGSGSGSSRSRSSGGGSGSGQQQQWIDVRRSAYLNRERQFLRKLMVAMHVTGGQPARGPELGSIKVVNSVFSARNIYVVNGRMVFLTMYDKARKRRGDTEYVLRCLPDEISQILAKYLIYVRPFSRVVGKQEWDFLFADEGGPWAGEQLTKALAVATAAHLGVRLTVLGWRQVAIAIANEHLGRVSRTWEQEEEGEDEDLVEGGDAAEVEMNVFQHILIRQSAHGQRVAQRHYAIDGAFLNYLGPALTNAYMQASRAWHAFFGLKSDGAAAVAVAAADERVKHGRQASQQLHPAMTKRERSSQAQSRHGHPEAITAASSRAMEGLRRIYGPDAKPQSEGQAAALELVHRRMAKTATTIIVLPTSSGKSVLFFSVAAMAVGQTVIVVVPFAALVDDILARASGSGIQCREWQGEGSFPVLPQLIVVSADRAVEGGFLHFAKGLELHGELSHVFFDECHVAFTDTSYRQRLRELYQLRYLDCPFICLTATLMVQLEPVLRANLLIPQAELFRRGTMRRTIRYTVQDSKERPPSEVATQLVRSLPLPPGKRGVIYVRSYQTGAVISSALQCPFYKARAEGKGELLAEWVSGEGGWIVATGALGTGINIAGIIYVVHVDRPYGLTSFMQQSGRGGRNGEVSDSYVVVRKQGGSGSSRGRRAVALVSDYSVEHQDEEALSEFLSTRGCRRAVLAGHLDGVFEGADCISTDSILCDQCRRRTLFSGEGGGPEAAEGRGGGSGGGRRRESDADGQSGVITGQQAITQAFEEDMLRDSELIQFMDELKRDCIYCVLIGTDGGESQGPHVHGECLNLAGEAYGIEAYRQWRQELELAAAGQCYRCGLGQEMCQAVEEGVACEYPHLMLPVMFMLDVKGVLEHICMAVGFQGAYDSGGWQWRWMNSMGEGRHGVPVLNWMVVWRKIGELYLKLWREQEEEDREDGSGGGSVDTVRVG